jgi:hypothetical protein
MKCSRCKKWIEGDEIKFAREGDWMGKPLCSSCRAEIEAESKNRYRVGRGKGNGYSKRNQYTMTIYSNGS